MVQLVLIYIHQHIVQIHRSQSPLTLPALWTDVPEARDVDTATHDEWLKFVEGQGSNCIPYTIHAYLTHKSVPLRWDCKVTANPFDTPKTSQRSCEYQQPWTVTLQLPDTHLELSDPSGAAYFVPFTHHSFNRPRETHQTQSPVEGSTRHTERFKLCLSL